MEKASEIEMGWWIPKVFLDLRFVLLFSAIKFKYLDLVHLGIYVVIVREQGGDITSLVQPRTQDTTELPIFTS